MDAKAGLLAEGLVYKTVAYSVLLKVVRLVGWMVDETVSYWVDKMVEMSGGLKAH